MMFVVRTTQSGLTVTNVDSLQPGASHPETFTPSVLSVPPAKYAMMMREFHLPFKGLEGSGAAGPLFWTWAEEDHGVLRMCSS